MSLIAPFIAQVQDKYKSGVAREHAYRPALETLLKALDNTLNPINDAARIDVGAPDFIILKDSIPIGYLEAKDIGLDLRKMNGANMAQQARYLGALPNLIYTNCLDWDFYRNGQLIASVTIADYLMGIQPRPEDYAALESLLRDFVTQRPQTITSPSDLAARMAGKAQLIKDVLFKTLAEDPTYTSDLGGHYKAFQNQLIHDISPADFADIYAETIAYGMFAARLHDTSLNTFSRVEAHDLLPKSNPFLRQLFGFIAGPNLDERIKWVIDDLAEVFRAADVAKIMSGFGRLTGQQDPFLHFYETFLGAYDAKKKKARGVWYTPEPVVNFIVRAVDDVLKSEFNLRDGLADTQQITVDWDTGQSDNKGAVTVRKEMHRVQILDPATGTGTFLAEVIKHIAPTIKANAPGNWSQYIEQNLIPRLHGFELLMASYAMCHMKLDMILTELGYKPTGAPPRLGVYLTNSLEQGDRDVRDLFMAKWLSDEARGASTIKRQTPIMCVVGNPPYSVSSSNRGEYAQDLVAAYKDGLEETSLNSLSDDYVKFIRLAEKYIAENKIGVLGMITNNSFLDGVVHRKMREHLRRTFDQIYIINLHGDANKKERTPEGLPDKNVFDIMQGVAIMIAVKSGKKFELGQVKVADAWGARQAKYDLLQGNSLASVDFEDANYNGDFHFFTRKDFSQSAGYDQGFFLSELFQNFKSGIKTERDSLTIAFSSSELEATIEDLRKHDTEVFRARYNEGPDGRDWKLGRAKDDVLSHPKSRVKILYRPFDVRHTCYTGTTKGFHAYPRSEIMPSMLETENLALIVGRQNKSGSVDHFLVSDLISEMKTGERTIQSYHFPLYLFEASDQSRRVNFDPALFKGLQDKAAHPPHGTPDEVAVFDYIYGVLHCPAYRQTYAEFLKIDFPRIPWPASPDAFWDISAKGAQLRALHLMQPAAIGATPYPFEGDGNSVVDRPRFENGRVWINDTQFFANAPSVAWEFFIGGYQPAQKWLKDRRGRVLAYDDIRHYQSILKILSETARIMETIEMEL